MALVLVSPLQKGRRAFTSKLLLNSKRVVDFRPDTQYPLSRTVMFYNAKSGKHGGTWELLLNHFVNTVSTRLFEDETNQFLWVNVLAYSEGVGIEKPTTSKTNRWKINAEAVVWAEDISTTQSYIYLERGDSIVRLKTSHVVADLSRALSTSASLSKS